MEKGECPLLVRSTKCKRRKISAIRSLPCRTRSKGSAQCLSLEPNEEDCSDNLENSKNSTCDLKKEIVFPLALDDDRFMSPPNGSIPIGNGNGLEKSIALKCPTRRAVLAIRDLPQLCRRNVGRISRGESLGVLDSLKTENFGQGKCEYGMDGKILKERMKVQPKESLEALASLKNKGLDKEMLVDDEMLMGTVKCDVKQSEGDAQPKGESKEVLDYVEKKSVGQGKFARGREKLSGVKRLETKNASERKVNGNNSKRKSLKKNDRAHMVILNKENSLEHNEYEDLHMAPLSKDHKDDGGDDTNFTRNKVQEILCLFRKLLQEDAANSKEARPRHRRADYQVAKTLQDKYNIVITDKQIFGRVPGVEVGDEFNCRMELSIIGLHRQTQSGINCARKGEKTLATSIVASEDHTDDLDNSNVLIYSGQGGTAVYLDKKPEDQKLENGNLALKNSMDEKNPVRVIRGCDPYKRRFRKFVYIGLYLVERFWEAKGPHGNRVFKFQLERIPGQPEVSPREVKQSKRSKVKKGFCVDDISQGKEVIPIRAVNTIDDEKPPPFKYRTNCIYPDWCHFSPPKGCDCISGCSDSRKCSCAVKNGGEIPYNSEGAVVETKTLVYECGPSCKCPPSCHNRVSQHGIKFKLEIFKTKLRGWGLRSRNFIPIGSFICEYVGELLNDEQAEKRAGYDDYLFDIGKNCDNSSRRKEDVEDDGGFTIDAKEYGNVGRFINHSCSPNLYAQNILFDHEDKSIPHIMFFAAEKIHPLEELTYDYNYIIDQVRDANGNIKKKSCFCGSPECTGRMY